MNGYTPLFYMDVISYACPYFNAGLWKNTRLWREILELPRCELVIENHGTKTLNIHTQMWDNN